MFCFKYLHLIVLSFAIVIIIGCSNGGNPVSPDETPSQELTVSIPDNLANGSTEPFLFGLYEVELNRGDLSGEIHPLRTSGVLGDSFDVDITPFLAVTPCSDCIDIKSIALSEENYVEVTFRTKHPFEPTNRYDLHVFDMRGIIVVGNDTTQFNRVRIDMDADGSYETAARGNVSLLKNADGYTSFYDLVVEDYIGKIFDSNICPYKNLWVNPATESPDSNYNPSSQYGFSDLQNPTGHNVFPMGGTFDNPLSETTYQFDFSNTDSISFLFILEASYGHTTFRFTRKEPRYFLPEFHRKEAWKVDAELTNNNLIAGNSSSSAVLELAVVDWQAGMIPTGGWDYGSSNLDAIKYASDVKQIVIDIPNVLQIEMTADLSELVTGTGTHDDPYRWEFDILNELSAPEGTYYGLIAVRDDLQGTPNTPYGVSGDKMTPVKYHDLTTYQAFEVEIEYVNVPPVADLVVDPNPVRVSKDVIISVGPLCNDPDGVITKYEYDLDYDGSNFNADVTQNNGDPEFGDDVVVQFDETEIGLRTIAQRVTDNGLDTDIATVDLLVNENQAPTAEIISDEDDVTVCDTVTFEPGSACNDPDGTIEMYEYDFDYDGSNFNADVTQLSTDGDFGDPVTNQFANNGSTPIIYTVALRVSDDGSPVLTAIDTVDITVNNITGQILFEDFEESSPGGVPDSWGIVGHTGGAYYLNTAGTACTDTTWRWGVTDNSALCEGGEDKFLNESGAVNTDSDPNETYQNRGHIVYTPEFQVPPTGATVTIRHNFNFLYGVLSGARYLDGGAVVLSIDDPGIMDWSDFCNTYESEGDNHPLRHLPATSGPAQGLVSSYAVATHPLYNMRVHIGSSAGWVTSTYNIPDTYACETVRLGFLFASDDLLLGYLSSPPVEFYTDCSQYLDPPYNSNIYPGWGWRINWVDVTAN